MIDQIFGLFALWHVANRSVTTCSEMDAESGMVEPVNIVCMKWGTLYGPEHNPEMREGFEADTLDQRNLV